MPASSQGVPEVLGILFEALRMALAMTRLSRTSSESVSNWRALNQSKCRNVRKTKGCRAEGASRKWMEGVAKKKKRVEQEVKDHYGSQTKNKRQKLLGQVKQEQIKEELNTWLCSLEVAKHLAIKRPPFCRYPMPPHTNPLQGRIAMRAGTDPVFAGSVFS